MKIFVRILSLSLLILIIQSCCTKKGCDGSVHISEIYFSGFTWPEQDTVDVIRYSNGAFIDSVRSVSVLAKDNSYSWILLKDEMNFSYEYKITIVSSGQTFMVSNFIFKKSICNETLLFNTPCDYSNDLNSYEVNGVTKEETNVIRVTK